MSDQTEDEEVFPTQFMSPVRVDANHYLGIISAVMRDLIERADLGTEPNIRDFNVYIDALDDRLKRAGIQPHIN